MSSFVVRATTYERTLIAVMEQFPAKFSGPTRRLSDGLAEPLSDPKPKPFVNPCPTVVRLARGAESPAAIAKRFDELLARIRVNWGLSGGDASGARLGDFQ